MSSFSALFQYYRHYKAIALFSIVADSFLGLSDLVVFYTIGQILNVISNQGLDWPINHLVSQLDNVTNLDSKILSLGLLITVFFIATVVKAPIQVWLGPWFHWKVALDARRDNTQKVIAKILTLPLSFYDENNPGRIAGRVAKGITNHTWTYPEITGVLIPKLVRVVAIFVVILLIEWWIAIAFILSFLAIFIFSCKNLNDLIKEEEKLDRYIENTESRTSEIITNIKTVKAFATEAQEFKRQKQRINREYKMVVYNIHLGYVKLATLERTAVQICIFCLLILILIPTLQATISLGYFITTLTMVMMAYSELDPISQLAETFARRYASMIRLDEFMKLPAGKDAASLIPEYLPENPYKFTGKVELSHVSFGYNPQRIILQDINLLIEPYQTVALVGRSGSGKSTLIKLLFRYFDPNQGKILIDGEDIRKLDIARYRRRLGIVHQDVDIFNGTVLDNLTYGNPGVTLEQVEQACEIAKVDEFIHELPQGYSTVVGERGVRLSGGQRQRLGIARALIVDPDILVFDEATSSLDYESERAIQLAMNSILGTRTTIIIAHRLSTVREADNIVVFDTGRIVEVGSHEELLNHQGIYHRLHSLQETGEIL